jgi:tetratricopeptide (TPR) repeat protein
MPTKFSRYCSGVMEAAWLAAVSLIPIFFDIYSSRIFEPDKIIILRSLALLSLAAWLLKLIDEGGVEWKPQSHETSFIQHILHYPMFAPVFGLVIVYILSTIFSVTPAISLFGSYQRLQGTYTTFSYLVIFASIVSQMRTRYQVNRLVTTVILASLPVALYGLLQRYQIDPIPWGGDVSIRIASNMGNSIFVAAYLIMVFPLTVGRMVAAFREILADNSEIPSGYKTTKQIIKATIYVFIAALELIAIYMSGSRGPLLGLMAGTYLLVLLMSLYWKKRWLTFAIIGLALFGAGFLVIFNMTNGPLETLKKSPYIGRFGKLLDPESNSALVRQYIWEGAVDLVGIHEPIKFPDGGTDKFNFLRPLLGYGPESMYVAYNQFYQPDLGQVEKRNASPDRSHNETWDSIVITGLAGLLVYLSIFSFLFYYGLKWQGLIRNVREKYFFFICLIGGGIVGSIVFILLRGIEFLGVGLPFGMIIGVVLYLTIYALISSKDAAEKVQQSPYALLLIVLFAAIVGHFVEINFGIAIVATRTLFWTYAAVMVVIGYIMPKLEVAEVEVKPLEVMNEVKSSYSDRKRSKRTPVKQGKRGRYNSRPLIGGQPDWVRNSLISGFIIGIILTTLGYDYITNSGHNTSFISVVINSLTRLVSKDNAISLGVMALLTLTWVIGVLLFTAEYDENQEGNNGLRAFVLTGVASLIIGVLFWILHAISLAILEGFSPANQNDVIMQVNSIGSLLTKYYIYIFLLIILVAFLLPEEWPPRGYSKSPLSLILAPIAIILLLISVNISNLKVIHADITFKMAEPFTKSSQWQVATFLYKRALELVPKEDHYYLFLGRSYLEQAKITEAAADQDKLVLQAEEDLQVAQSINPLNTDHTANLARLYSWWAGKATTTDDLGNRGQKASEYYSMAVTLSPNNSTLWDEWAVLFMQVLGQAQEAFDRLQQALSLDERYSFTQGLLGDYYMRIASSTEDVPTKVRALEAAVGYYQTAADVYKKGDTTSKASYLVSLGNVYILLDGLDSQNTDHAQLRKAADKLIESMDAGLGTSDLWKVQEIIAKLYLQLGEKSLAQYYANQALMNAPSAVTSRIQELVNQIEFLP